MRVTFPYMGYIYIPLRGILKSLDCEVIVPPKPNRQTLETGTRLSPELMCIPFKITLGNFINALDMGADTIVHTGGSWSCRYGYYGRLHQNILRDLGYQFSAFVLRHDELSFIYKKVLELNKGSFSRTLNRIIKAFLVGWYKSNLLELVEVKSRRLRPYELVPGNVEQLFQKYCKRIDQTFSLTELSKMKKDIISDYNSIPADFTRKTIRIKMVGEAYCMIEPFINFNLITKLGNMGVLIEPFLTASRWVGFHSIRIGKSQQRFIQNLARPYWRYCVGGEDINSIGHTILAARQGFDGVIHLHPFACMPATVSQPVLTKISQDYNIPFLSLSLDEHTQEVGFYNRVEAFVSILERRRKQKLNA
jgi:predicted nucleotide-binding protein (sugar kinase/HSP70/actin superfamily)